MSDEYILKADAIAIAESYNVEGFNLNDYEYGRDQVAISIASDLEDVKPADVAPIIYGEWVIGGYTDFDSPYCSLDKSDINPTCHDKYYICNKCGHRPQKYFKPRAKYCPECGANMFAKKQEESNG